MKLFPHLYWTTQDKTEIRISTMTDSHLKNTIAYLNEPRYYLFDFILSDNDIEFTKVPHFKDRSKLNAKIWKELNKELKKRKLTSDGELMTPIERPK